MTSYRHPDYDVRLGIAPAVFSSIAGVSFAVVVGFGARREHGEGMLIIPEGQEVSESDPNSVAWLWSEEHANSGVGEEITIELAKPCEPMLTSEAIRELETHCGTFFVGVIIKNWNTEHPLGHVRRKLRDAVSVDGPASVVQ